MLFCSLPCGSLPGTPLAQCVPVWTAWLRLRPPSLDRQVDENKEASPSCRGSAKKMGSSIDSPVGEMRNHWRERLSHPLQQTCGLGEAKQFCCLVGVFVPCGVGNWSGVRRDIAYTLVQVNWHDWVAATIEAAKCHIGFRDHRRISIRLRGTAAPALRVLFR